MFGNEKSSSLSHDEKIVNDTTHLLGASPTNYLRVPQLRQIISLSGQQSMECVLFFICTSSAVGAAMGKLGQSFRHLRLPNDESSLKKNGSGDDMTGTPTLRNHRRGGVLVYTAIVLFVLIGFIGLAIDWGYMTWTAQKLQNAADAAALAGAQQVWTSQTNARNAAVNYAALNEAGSKSVALNFNATNDAAGDVVVGQYDRAAHTFTVTTNRQVANAVRVVARRTTGSAGGALPLFFGPMFGKNTAEVARYGIAVAVGGPADTSVIALNSSDPKAFYIYGNGYMDLGDGAAQVDSSNQAGAVFQGTSLTFIAGQVNMVGAWDEKGNPNLNSVDLNPQEPYVSDPLAGLPVPATGAPMNPQQINPSSGALTTYNPGYYPKGLDLQSGDKAFLNPGVYILENGNSKKPSLPAFAINGHAELTGYGVMFYIKFGSVVHNGTGDVHLTPPSSGVYKGIQFFQARNNTEPAVFNGTSIFTGASADTDHGAGTLYFPAAKVTVGGNGNMYIDSLIADKIEVSGDGKKYITKGYDGRKGGDPVYLVE
jgi:Flp pilus assembly protein TadG